MMMLLFVFVPPDEKAANPSELTAGREPQIRLLPIQGEPHGPLQGALKWRSSPPPEGSGLLAVLRLADHKDPVREIDFVITSEA